MSRQRVNATLVSLLWAVVCTMLAQSAAADEPFSIRTVFTSDELDPPMNSSLYKPNAPSINSHGHVAVDIVHCSSISDLRLVADAKGVTHAARSGDPIPIGDGQTSTIEYFWSYGALISDDDRTSYACLPSSSDSLCFASQAIDGPAELVAREHTQPPDFPEDMRFEWFGTPYAAISGEYKYGRSGAFSFHATMHQQGTGHRYGSIWIGDETQLQKVACRDDIAPGINGTATFDGGFTVFYETGGGSLWRSPCINARNEVAFYGSLTGTGIDATNDAGIWIGAPDSLELTARKGQHVSGLASNEVLGDFASNPAINNSQQTSFTAKIVGNDVEEEDDYAVFADVAGQLEVIMRESMPAPGTPKDVVFDDNRCDHAPSHMAYEDILHAPLVDDSGLVAFMACLRGDGVDDTNSIGLWTKAREAPLTLLARMGDPVPGMDESAVFDTLGFWKPPGQIEYPPFSATEPIFSLNGNGQIAFYAEMSGDGIDASNDGGIWATDANGELHLIVREGDQLEVAPGDVRTIGSLWFSQGGGGSDGSARAFNERGELVFVATFTDDIYSSGVFVATIPEPTTLLLLGLGACLIARRPQCRPRI